MQLDGIEVNLAGLLGMVVGNDNLGEVPALGVRYRCPCNRPHQEEVRTLRLFLSGDRMVFRCWACGWIGGVLEFAFKVTGATSGDDEIRVTRDRFFFPEGVDEYQIQQLERYRRAMHGFNQWRCRLRYEASPSGAVRLPHYQKFSAWGWEAGFGDYGLALQSELASYLPQTPHPKRWGRSTFVRVALVRGIFGQPVRIIILDPGLTTLAVDGHLCGIPVDLAPGYQGPLLSAPRSIEWADIGSQIVLTANPGIATDILRQMIKQKADLWDEIPRVDPDRRPEEHGLPVALLHTPSCPVGPLPFEKVVFAHRPGDVPDVALTMDDPSTGVTLHEHSDDDRFDLTAICRSGGRPIAAASACSVRRRAEEEGKCPFRLLRELSTLPYLDQSTVAAVAGNIAGAIDGDAQAELDALQLEEARFLQIGNTRYRSLGRRYFRTSPRRKPIAISNFCLRILEDRIDAEGLLSSHLLRLVMGKRFADFEISNRDFEDPRNFWLAIRSVAASHAFGEYPSLVSTVEQGRLSQIVLATQAPARQVRVGQLGFGVGGAEFNFPSYTIGRPGVLRRRNLAPAQFRVVGEVVWSLPDLEVQKRNLVVWVGGLSGIERKSALALVAASVAWLHRARIMGRSLIAFQTADQLEFLSRLLGSEMTGRGRASGRNSRHPKILMGNGRSVEKMETHGAIVAGIAHRSHWLSEEIFTVVTAEAPKAEPAGSGLLPLILHACVRASTAEEALQLLFTGSEGDPLMEGELTDAASRVSRPGQYLSSFFGACRRVNAQEDILSSRSRHFLPIDRTAEKLEKAGYSFERRRVSHEIRAVYGFEPHFYGASKRPTWELSSKADLGMEVAAMTKEIQKPGERVRAAFRLGVVHAYLEWSNRAVISREMKDESLRRKYENDISPEVEQSRRLSCQLKESYVAGYRAMALNCASRTLGCYFVTESTSSFFENPLALDLDVRLSVFVESRDDCPSTDDPHFRRTMENRDLLEGGARPATGIRGHSTPVGGLAVSRM